MSETTHEERMTAMKAAIDGGKEWAALKLVREELMALFADIETIHERITTKRNTA